MKKFFISLTIAFALLLGSADIFAQGPHLLLLLREIMVVQVIPVAEMLPLEEVCSS
jgi:hypothetical protein